MHNQAHSISIPTLKVLPNGVCIYKAYQGRPRRGRHSLYQDPEFLEWQREQQTINENRKGAYGGRVTVGMRARLLACVDLLLSSAVLKIVRRPSTGAVFRFRVNFVTLTLSDPATELSDRDIKSKLLDPWLKRMRYRHHLNSYIWKAERQQNGALHFHLITDTWLPWVSVRDNWNDLQRKHGLLESYRSKFNRDTPNSTDVHAVHRENEARKYIAKYLAKKATDESTISGRLWDASVNLKSAKCPSAPIDNQAADMLDRYCRANPDAQISKQYLTWITMPDREKRGNLPPGLLAEYKAMLLKIRAG